MKELTLKPEPEEFGKEQFKFLLKIKDYENKNEFNRFLLIASFGGILSIIAGFMELIFYKYYGMDVIFFQYNIFNSSDSILLLSVWIITIFPLFIITIFTSASSGVISWNKTYKIIGFIAIILFAFSEMTILFLGKSITKFIPVIWGIYIFIGFLLAGFLMNKLEQQSFVEKLLYLLGFLALLNSIIAYSFFDPSLAMYYMLNTFGTFLVLFASLIYIFEMKFLIVENLIFNKKRIKSD